MLRKSPNFKYVMVWMITRYSTPPRPWYAWRLEAYRALESMKHLENITSVFCVGRRYQKHMVKTHYVCVVLLFRGLFGLTPFQFQDYYENLRTHKQKRCCCNVSWFQWPNAQKEPRFSRCVVHFNCLRACKRYVPIYNGLCGFGSQIIIRPITYVRFGDFITIQI